MPRFSNFSRTLANIGLAQQGGGNFDTTYPTIDPDREQMKINFNNSNKNSWADITNKSRTITSTGGGYSSVFGGPFGANETGTPYYNSIAGTSTAGVTYSDATYSNATATALYTGAESWSLEAHVWINSVATATAYFNLYQQTSLQGFAIRIGKSNTLFSGGQYGIELIASNSTGTLTQVWRETLTAFAVASWQHIVVSFTAVNAVEGFLRVYVNGGLQGVGQAITKTTGFDFYKTSTVRIGWINNTGQALPGRLDNFRMINENPWPTTGFAPPSQPFLD